MVHVIKGKGCTLVSLSYLLMKVTLYESDCHILGSQRNGVTDNIDFLAQESTKAVLVREIYIIEFSNIVLEKHERRVPLFICSLKKAPSTSL